MPGKVEDLAEEAFTKAPPNRPLQALLLAFFVLPQLVVYSFQEDNSAYTELGALLKPAALLKNWQRWLQDEKFVLVLVLLAFERMVYTIVWLFPAHFVHFAKLYLRPILIHVGKDQPLDCIVFLFYVSKVFQFGSMFGYYFAIGPLPTSISLFRWVLGLQLFLVGQFLNAAIYNAIGKAGVYYGYKIGVQVPWCTGFPFNVFTMHPQYAGVCASIFGGGILMLTEKHASGGFGGVGICAALYYFYMSMVEDMPAEHPADKRPGQGTVGAKDVRLRDLRSLKWSSHLAQGWDTTDNLLGFMTRPWFPSVVAAAALLNCFFLVLPVNCLFIVFCIRNSFSVLPSALNVAGGVAIGVALLAWAVESSGGDSLGDRNICLGQVCLAMPVDEIRAHWPVTRDYVQSLGLNGCLLAFGFAHPLPIVVFAMRHGVSVPPLIVAAFLGAFVYHTLLGATAVAASALLRRAYRVVFAAFDPETTIPTAAPAASSSKRRAASPRARAASPRRVTKTK